MSKLKKYLLPFSFIVLIGINSILKRIPEFVETYYSNGLYIGISKLNRYVFGWLPFSVGDILYSLILLYIIRWFWLNKGRLIKDFKNFMLEILTAFSIIYFAFHLFWAFNYYRQPLHKSLGIESNYTTEQLVNTISLLIDKSNAIHSKLESNDTLKIEIPFTKSEILTKVSNGYDNLSEKFPQLDYSPTSIKTSLYSLPLTYMGFSGYLNPFTNEAQVDKLIPKYKFPTTASHEAAHQLGYAAENEANFIGALAAVNNDNLYFNYSGYTFMLRHCLGELYKRDPEKYELQIKTIRKGILKNYREVRQFWNDYENLLEPLFKTSYDSFLKSNNQAKGIEGYSYVVALYVNYFENL